MSVLSTVRRYKRLELQVAELQTKKAALDGSLSSLKIEQEGFHDKAVELKDNLEERRIALRQDELEIRETSILGQSEDLEKSQQAMKNLIEKINHTPLWW